MPSMFLRLAGLLLVIIVLACTFYTWSNLSNSSSQTKLNRFNLAADQSAAGIAAQFEVYANTLYSGRALFVSGEPVTRTSWDGFVKAQNISQRYPAITSIDYVTVVSRTNLQNFLQQLTSEQQPGTPTITVFPTTQHEQLAILTYYSAQTNRQNIIGYDLMSDPARSRVLGIARDDNVPRASVPLKLTGDTTVTGPSIVIVLPVYKATAASLSTVADRRDDLQGYVAMGLHLKPIIASVVAQSAFAGQINVQVVTNGETIYSTGTTSSSSSSLKKTIRLDLAGQTWNLAFTAPKNYSLSLSAISAPYITLVSGILVAILLGITFYYAIGLRIVRSDKTN
ncbi:MAG TPA: CHASE domain-containing protein [Candidatus Saccharimonadales bacterium]|nr:CHASE domain-containing protein [Candidatus Saccharimonadales bacterium]